MAATDLVAYPISRRAVLKGGSLVGLSAFIAACGSSGSTPAATSGPAATPMPSADGGSGPIEGPLNFANWPAYIDLNDDESASPTLEDFQTKYGFEVNYVEDIQSNEDFFATLAQPLQAGLDTGWDLIVLTDYMAARLVRLGWAEKIDPANVPTALANVRDELRNLGWDPDMTYHMPWQSGATGLGYNVVSTGKDLTAIADLFDPAWKGKVTLLTGWQDTYSLISLLLLKQGVISNTPPDLTLEDAQKITDYLLPFVDSGHIRAFTGNEYLQDFGSGDTWVAEVWSGDLASSGGDDDRFVYPTEGSIIWTDNMQIPKGAVHKAAAEAMIDFVYDVGNAARLAAWIYYISPVKGVADFIRSTDAELADNPLLFPPPDVTAKQYAQADLTDEEDLAFVELSAGLEGR
ncbi:MAG: spermidine/putrescine ABC transporter substrate-binding protein [Chloroflexi bacterium]|nr:spermidine/putrescine ABC transporter substrate-binding protein [Chloroflexota bacterium]